MKKTILSLLLFAALMADAQNFVTEAKIEYEKTVNTRKLMEKRNIPDAFKDGMPAETKTYYDLLYKNNQAMYQKGRDAELKNAPMWGGGTQDDRKVYTDFSAGTTTQKKSVVWEDYFIQDTMYNIKWRITMDTRNIAGYECRRATAVVFDSVFVVAFYTDEIVGNGGPESFGGLPGMILGLVIPRIHTSWYATTVRPALLPKEAEQLKIPVAGKKTKVHSFKSMSDKINETTKNWTWESSNNQIYLWNILW